MSSPVPLIVQANDSHATELEAESKVAIMMHTLPSEGGRETSLESLLVEFAFSVYVATQTIRQAAPVIQSVKQQL